MNPSMRRRTSRRDFLKVGASGAAALVTGRARQAGAAPVRKAAAPKPNFLFILCDQLGLDAIGAHGDADVRTPNLDRLIKRGTTFLESHSTNPVCSPARSSLLTGRMTTETGVISNGRPIHQSCPNLGQWFARAGYEAIYCGKWHLPAGYQAKVPGFATLPARSGQGDLSDTAVSHACEAYIRNRGRDKPYLMIASFLQPHDICYWGNVRQLRMPRGLPFEQIRDELPKLPPNNKARPKAPQWLDRRCTNDYSDEQWRYYLYIYSRMVEMLDADVGRVLRAVEDAGQADNTVIVFTSDHGDGRGRHMHVSKWYPYDEAVKVPMILSCPGRIAENTKDTSHLVSGLDVMSTLCDFAGIKPPDHARGRSLRPLLEKKNVTWREFVVANFGIDGRVVRSDRYKYVHFKDDPVEQLFDMKADPWETKNLYDQARYASVMKDHRKLLKDFESHLRTVEPTAGRKRPVRRTGRKGS